MPKRVSVQITADSSGFDATVSGMAGKTRRSADEIKAAAGQAIGSVSALTAANSRLVTAQARVADAAGAVRAAEARLAQVRGRARSTTLQNATAEEALAKAHRASILAQRDLASAQDKNSLAKRLGTTEVQSAGRAISVAGLAIGAGVALAVRASANFEQAMSGVASTGHYTSGQLDLLSKAAIAGGQATQFSATEAAQGEAELVKAGLSVQNVLGGGLTGALNLAAAGNLSVADAASAAATAINQFGLQGADATHVADRFVQIAGVAQGETSDVAEAFKNGAVSASQYGLSIDDASDVTAAFAKNGVVGAQAGTLMRSALTNLYAPTNSVQKALDKLGVSAYDAAGNALPIADVAGQLHDKLAPLNEDAKNNALARIFGKETLQGGAILAKEGAAGLGAIRAELDKFPTAAQTAATKMDNLKGDIEQLSGSLETGLIKTGSGANGFLRDLAQGATKAVNEFTDLPGAVQKGTLVVGTLASAGLLGAGGLIKLVSAATTAKVALDTLGASGSRVPGVLGGIGKAAGVAVVALAALYGAGKIADQFRDAPKSLGDAGQAIAGIGKNADGASPSLDKFFSFTNTGGLDLGSGKIEGLAGAFEHLGKSKGAAGFFDSLTSKIPGVTSGTEEIEARFSKLDQVLTQTGATSAPQAAAGFAAIAKTAAAQKVPLDQLVALFPQYKQQLQDQATALGVTVPDSAQVYADWMGGKVPAAVLAAAQANPKAAASFGVVATAADQSAKGFATAQDALKNLINPQKISGQAAQDLSTKLFGSAQAAIAASNAQIAYAQAVRQAKASTGGGIDPKTDKGASNLSLLNQQASAYQQVASAQIAAGKSAGTVSAGTQKARDSFIANAEAMGVNSGKAKDLADKYGLIPKNVKVKIEEQVQKNAEDELTKLKALDGTIITPKIQALIDQGKYKQALSALKDVQKDRRAKVKAEADTKGAEGKLKSAAKTRQAALKAQAQGVEAESGKLNRAARKRQAELAAKATGVSPAAAAFTRAAKKRQAEIKAQATGTGAANAAINAVAKPRTVNIHVVTTKSTRIADNDKGATGGMFTPAGFIMRRSMGGPVWGAGTATSDSIPALLSNGEFVINAKSVKAIGADRLSYANREGVLPKFAGGGSVRALAEGGLAATTGKFQIADIYALLRALTQPVQDIATAAADVQREQARIGKPLAAKVKADKAYDKAKDRQEDLRDRVARLAKEAAATKGQTKADRDLAKARRALTAANNDVSKSSRAKTKAEQAYKDVAGPLEEATQRLTDAQKALADSSREVSDSFSSQYRSSSTDAQDWIDLMTTGATDLKTFNAEIVQLRKTGLSETLVQQIVAMGQVAGGEIANQIIAGGSSLAAALNTANANLQSAADDLGYTSSIAPKRYAVGGLLSGPGSGTSDSLNIRASTGEYVVNAAATAANRSVLDAINYGRATVTAHQFTPGYARGGFVRREPQINMAAVRAAMAGANFYVQSPITGEYFRAFVRSEAGGVLDQETSKLETAF